MRNYIYMYNGELMGDEKITSCEEIKSPSSDILLCLNSFRLFRESTASPFDTQETRGLSEDISDFRDQF